MKKNLQAIHPNDDIHYKKFKMKKDEISQWEDGLRTNNESGTYEWWYFDTHLNDGSIIVVVFYTKSPINPNGDIKPYVTFELTNPDGSTHKETVYVPVEECEFSKECCNVKIGKSYIIGDLKNYKIHFENENVQADISLEGTVPAWRSKCGSILFGNQEEYEFAWLPAVPEGNVKAEVTVNGKKKNYEGYGYHDHNWGNVSILKLMNNWYWGRAKIGPYTVITAWITAEKAYNFKEFDVFMIAKDGKILSSGDNSTIEFLPTNMHIDSHTGKPVHDKIQYVYKDMEVTEYKVTYNRENDIVKERFVDTLPSIQRIFAKLLGVSGAYLRFSGTAAIEVFKDGILIEKYKDPAVWELMYLGKNHI